MIATVTDSAANVPAEVARDLAIRVVPIHLRFGPESFRDGVDLVGGDFYDRLVRDDRAACTSAPSPGDFLEAYRATGADEVLCVTLSSGVSVSHHEAVLAAERFEGRVEVVDSHSATMGEGFVAIEAARAVRDGASLEAAAARARDVAGRTRVFGAIETFEFLRRSGRVNKLQAYAATRLDITPVFRLRGGDGGRRGGRGFGLLGGLPRGAGAGWAGRWGRTLPGRSRPPIWWSGRIMPRPGWRARTARRARATPTS